MSAATGRFRRSDRLLDSRDFRRVMRRGRRRAHPELVVLALRRSKNTRNFNGLSDDSETESSRLGLTASRKSGNAVMRNRFKRRVREWFRQRSPDLRPAVDLVVIARRSGTGLDFAQLDERLCELLDLERVQR